MATEFPIEPEYGRFIEGMTDEAEEGVEVELPEDEAEIEELPDGSAIVKMDTKGPEEDEDFYANLAEELDELELSTVALRYIKLVEMDKRAREERDKQY